MDDVSDDASFEPVFDICPHLQHLKASYWLTCDQRQGTIILRLTRVSSDNPTGIEWSVPVNGGHQRILIDVLNDGTLKGIGGADGIINT